MDVTSDNYSALMEYLYGNTGGAGQAGATGGMVNPDNSNASGLKTTDALNSPMAQAFIAALRGQGTAAATDPTQAALNSAGASMQKTGQPQTIGNVRTIGSPLQGVNPAVLGKAFGSYF